MFWAGFNLYVFVRALGCVCHVCAEKNVFMGFVKSISQHIGDFFMQLRRSAWERNYRKLPSNGGATPVRKDGCGIQKFAGQESQFVK